MFSKADSVKPANGAPLKGILKLPVTSAASDFLQPAKFGESPTFQAAPVPPTVISESTKQPTAAEKYSKIFSKKSTHGVNYFADQLEDMSILSQASHSSQSAAKESNGVKVAQSYDEIKAIRGSSKKGVVCKQAKKGKELSKLKQTTASIKEEIDELAIDKDSLHEENDNLKDELKCQKEEIAYLCEQIGEMRNRLKGASAETNSLEKLATQLELLNVSSEKERVANKERFKEDFEQMKSQFDDRYQMLSSKLEAKRNQRAKMQLRYNQSKMKNLQIKQQTELMKMQLEGRLAEATRKSQNLATLKQQLNERHAKEKAGIEKLRQDVKLASNKKDALEIEFSRLGDIEAKSKALAEKLDNRKGQFQEAKQRNPELLATVEKRTNRINELQSVNANKLAEMESLNELRKQREEKVDQLKTLLANQQQQAEQLDAVKTELIAESDTLSLQVAELSLEFDQRTSDKVSLTSILAVLRQDKDEQSRAIEDAQAELDQSLEDARILNEQSVNSNALAVEKGEQYLESEKENFNLTTDICKMYFANKAGKKELDSLVRETAIVNGENELVHNELRKTDEQCQQTEEQVEELKENIAKLQKSLTPYNEIQSKLNEMISSNHGFYRVIAERDETIRALQGQLAEEAEIIEKSKAERESMFGNMQEMLSKAKPPAKAKSPTPAKASARSSRSKSESSITRQALELTCSPSKSEFDYNAFMAPKSPAKSPAKKSATKAASNVKSPAKSPSNTFQMAATSGKRKLGEDSTWKKAESETALPRYSAKPESATAPAERGIDMSFVKKEIDSKEKRATTEEFTSSADKGKGPAAKVIYDSQDSDFTDLFA